MKQQGYTFGLVMNDMSYVLTHYMQIRLWDLGFASVF